MLSACGTAVLPGTGSWPTVGLCRAWARRGYSLLPSLELAENAARWCLCGRCSQEAGSCMPRLAAPGRPTSSWALGKGKIAVRRISEPDFFGGRWVGAAHPWPHSHTCPRAPRPGAGPPWPLSVEPQALTRSVGERVPCFPPAATALPRWGPPGDDGQPPFCRNLSGRGSALRVPDLRAPLGVRSSLALRASFD